MEAGKQLFLTTAGKHLTQVPVRVSEIYNGETYDARMEKPDGMKPGYDDHAWQPVVEKDYSKNNLIATYNEPVTKA